MKRLLLSFLAVSALLSIVRAEDMLIVGSDLLEGALVEPLTAFAESEGLDIEIDLYGSIPAMAQVRNGDATLAIVANADGGKFEEAGLKVIPFAYQVAFVVVNRNNPMREISLNQLAGIFGTTSETYYSRWGELNITGGMATRSIQPIVLLEPDSVVVELFKSVALNRSPLKQNIRYIEDYTSNREVVGGDSGAIAIFTYLPEDSSLKALSVADKEGIAYDPARENVYFGDYPLTLPFYIVYRTENAEEVRSIVRFLLGEEMVQSLEHHHFMPIPENPRKRAILDLDIGS